MRLLKLLNQWPSLAALAVAIALNLDRILFPDLALIRLHDTFDIAFPYVKILAENIGTYGFSALFPQILAGVTSNMLGGGLNFLLIPHFFLTPYCAYVFISVFVAFTAFLGMYLFLRDQFDLSDMACLAGALIFSGQAIFTLPEGFSIGCLPLFMWAFEKIFTSDKWIVRICCYCWVVFYFAASFFAITAIPIAALGLVHFLYITKVQKTFRNISLMALIWIHYPVLHLPEILDLSSLAPLSHRMSWDKSVSPGWIEATLSAVKSIFSLGYDPLIPLLGVAVILFCLVHEEKRYLPRIFKILAWLFVILNVFSIWFVQTPVWVDLKNSLSLLRSFQFDRVGLLTKVLMPVMLALCFQFVSEKEERINFRAALRAALAGLLVYALISFISNGLEFPFLTFKLWQIKYVKDILKNIQRLSVFVHILPVCIVIWLSYYSKYKNISRVVVLPCLAFAALSACDNRLHWQVNGKLNTYRNTFISQEIEQVKKLENDAINGFRVVSSAGYDTGPLNAGFTCADGYAMLYPQLYKDIWARIIEPEMRVTRAERDYFLGWGNRVYLFNWTMNYEACGTPPFNTEILKLLGVKYLFSPAEIKCPESLGMTAAVKPEAQPVLQASERGPARRSKFKKVVQEYLGEKKYWVYRNNEYAPLAFLTGTLKYFQDDKSLLDSMSASSFAQLTASTYARHDAAPAKERFNAHLSKVLSVKEAPDEVVVSIRNKHPVILNLIRNYDRKWRCEVDGVPAGVFRVYHAFMGVAVPAEAHSVRFYLDKSERDSFFGLFQIAVFALFALVLLFILQPARH